MNPLYNKLLADVNKALTIDDVELFHLHVDAIYIDFITAIAEQRLSPADAVLIAIVIDNKLINSNRELWYA